MFVKNFFINFLMAVCKGVGPFSIAWQAIILTDERTDRLMVENKRLELLTPKMQI